MYHSHCTKQTVFIVCWKGKCPTVSSAPYYGIIIVHTATPREVLGLSNRLAQIATVIFTSRQRKQQGDVAEPLNTVHRNYLS